MICNKGYQMHDIGLVTWQSNQHLV